VLLEYGQPLHAFDADKLNGYLCVRRAKEGESIVTLDGIKRPLTKESVLIAGKGFKYDHYKKGF
jgi:phenylalanyl-tRNA synthetase beta chain